MAVTRDRRPSGPVRAVSVPRKLPPHSLKAEAAVLSACMFGGAGTVSALRLTLKPEHFYSEAHRRIFEMCCALVDADLTVGVPDIAAHLMTMGRLEQVGGRTYLLEVYESAPALSHREAKSFAAAIANLAHQRVMLAKLQEAEGRLYLGVAPDELPAFSRELEAFLAPPDAQADEDGWPKVLHHVPPEWCVMSPPTRTWLLRDGRTNSGSLPLGKTGMLLAEGGAGKTTLLCQLALAIATGEPFLNWFEIATPGRVLLLMAEEERDDMQRQIYRAASARGTTLDPDKIVIMALHGHPCALLERDELGNVKDTDFAKWLHAYVKSQSFSLVVLDPVSRFAGLEAETDNAMATRYVQSTERIGALCGASVINSHHTNKGSRGGVGVTNASSRGSSAFTDGHRWVATLAVPDANLDEQADRIGEVVTLSFTKNNYELRGKPIVLRRMKGGALEPLEDDQVALVKRIQSGDHARQAKCQLRTAERITAQQERALAEAKEKEAKETALLALRRARDADDDLTVVRLRKEHPFATSRELVALVKIDRTCGTERAHDAVLRATVSRRPDPADPADPIDPVSASRGPSLGAP